jgi:hypothetical protein
VSEGGTDTASEASVVNPYDGDLFTLDSEGIGPAIGVRRTGFNWDSPFPPVPFD